MVFIVTFEGLGWFIQTYDNTGGMNDEVRKVVSLNEKNSTCTIWYGDCIYMHVYFMLWYVWML